MVLHLMNLSQSLDYSLLQKGVSIFCIQQSIILSDRIFESFDHAANGREHQVYTQKSVACNFLELVLYRALVGVCFTELEVKNIPRRLTLWMLLMMVAKCWKILE